MSDTTADGNPLPSDWVSHMDPASGNEYFANSVTGEVRWTDPTIEETLAADDAGDVELTSQGNPRSKRKKKGRTKTVRGAAKAAPIQSVVANPAVAGNPLFEVTNSWKVKCLYSETSAASFFPGVVRLHRKKKCAILPEWSSTRFVLKHNIITASFEQALTSQGAMMASVLRVLVLLGLLCFVLSISWAAAWCPRVPTFDGCKECFDENRDQCSTETTARDVCSTDNNLWFDKTSGSSSKYTTDPNPLKGVGLGERKFTDVLESLRNQAKDLKQKNCRTPTAYPTLDTPAPTEQPTFCAQPPYSECAEQLDPLYPQCTKFDKGSAGAKCIKKKHNAYTKTSRKSCEVYDRTFFWFGPMAGQAEAQCWNGKIFVSTTR